MRILTIFFFALMAAFPGYTQGLFESAGTPPDDPQKRMEWSGYARGSAYGGAEQFDYSSVFGEVGIQGKYAIGKAFLFADMRLREGLQFKEVGATLQLKEAYAGYQSKRSTSISATRL
ncbi:MAG: hypothetical protein IPJ40_00655 [Saprospirales bacterium]|nr:hypothetical protein [Saprospirales bacterium]